MEDKQELQPRRRRRHSAEFKQQVIQACRQPGVSIAAIAVHYRLNANLVRRWVAAREERATAAVREPAVLPSAQFIPLTLTAPQAPTASQDIVIEVRRGAAIVTVRWPHAAAGDCARWLQGWLR